MFNACNYNITIAELEASIRDANAVFTQEEYEELINHLAVYPESGKVIPDTGGIRKLRWPARGQGKRGGARVIYYFRDLNMPVYILAVYAKGEKLDLTAKEKRLMRDLVDEIVREKLKVTLRLVTGKGA